MKTKIREVQLFFIEKLMKGEFEIVEIDRYIIKVVVADREFSLWIGNWQIADCLEQHFTTRYNFMNLNLTNEQRLDIYKTLYVLHGAEIEKASGEKKQIWRR